MRPVQAPGKNQDPPSLCSIAGLPDNWIPNEFMNMNNLMINVFTPQNLLLDNTICMVRNM